MINSSYESNGKIISIQSILAVLSLFKDLDILLIIVESSNCISLIFTQLDSSHQKDFIDVYFMPVALILTKLL
jgi:hypothetical protein